MFTLQSIAALSPFHWWCLSVWQPEVEQRALEWRSLVLGKFLALRSTALTACLAAVDYCNSLWQQLSAWVTEAREIP